jgi:hypothetical protein
MFDSALNHARYDLGCLPGDAVWTHVPDAEREHISVRLAADANPFQPRSKTP